MAFVLFVLILRNSRRDVGPSPRAWKCAFLIEADAAKTVVPLVLKLNPAEIVGRSAGWAERPRARRIDSAETRCLLVHTDAIPTGIQRAEHRVPVTAADDGPRTQNCRHASPDSGTSVDFGLAWHDRFPRTRNMWTQFALNLSWMSRGSRLRHGNNDKYQATPLSRTRHPSGSHFIDSIVSSYNGWIFLAITSPLINPTRDSPPQSWPPLVRHLSQQLLTCTVLTAMNRTDPHQAHRPAEDSAPRPACWHERGCWT